MLAILRYLPVFMTRLAVRYSHVYDEACCPVYSGPMLAAHVYDQACCPVYSGPMLAAHVCDQACCPVYSGPMLTTLC